MELTVEEQIELEYLESIAKSNYITSLSKPFSTVQYLDEDSAIRYKELMIKLTGES